MPGIRPVDLITEEMGIRGNSWSLSGLDQRQVRSTAFRVLTSLHAICIFPFAPSHPMHFDISHLFFPSRPINHVHHTIDLKSPSSFPTYIVHCKPSIISCPLYTFFEFHGLFVRCLIPLRRPIMPMPLRCHSALPSKVVTYAFGDRYPLISANGFL